MKKYDVIIIGGGAAGTMAAIWASKKRSVLLLEKNNKIGKKILATGNGRCNLTNLYTSANYFHGSNFDFITQVLKRFDQNKTIDYFKKLEIEIKEEDSGRIFPKSDQAQSIVSALQNELMKSNVDIIYNSIVNKIKYTNLWNIFTNKNIQYTSDKLIIATGGKSSEQFGSSGDGYSWAQIIGHHIIPTYPALVSLETKEKWVKNIQGIKLKCNVKIKQNNKIISQKDGDIIFTHFGISGPAIMTQSRFVAPIINNDNVFVDLDLFSDKNIQQLDELLKNIIGKNGAKSIKNCLAYILPLRLAIEILKVLNIRDTKKSAEISRVDRQKIVFLLKKLVIGIKKLRPFNESQVTRGGIDTKEIDPKTMQSKIIPSLYFAGEIVDVDGDTGGFNLQWAWSSGYVAGISV